MTKEEFDKIEDDEYNEEEFDLMMRKFFKEQGAAFLEYWHRKGYKEKEERDGEEWLIESLSPETKKEMEKSIQKFEETCLQK